MEKNKIFSNLGLNVKEIEVHATNIWKMVWEQVLLVAIYARRCYDDERPQVSSFHQRMKLLSLIEGLEGKYKNTDFSQGEISDISSVIRDMVEDNKSSNDILEFLFDDASDREYVAAQVKTTTKKRIRSKMAEQGIAFPALSEGGLKYSYHSLYRVLKDPIDVFQRLLEYPEPDTAFIENTIYSCIANYIQEQKAKFSFVEDNLEHSLENLRLRGEMGNEKYITENIAIFNSIKEEEKEAIKQSFFNSLLLSEEVEGVSEWGLASWSSMVISSISDSSFDNRQFFSKIKKRSIYKTVISHNDIDINLKVDQLKSLIGLGLLNNLFSDIAEDTKNKVLNDKARPTSSLKSESDSISAFKKVSNWYRVNKTELFRKSNQLPKLIASIIEFDIMEDQGMFSLDFKHDSPNTLPHIINDRLNAAHLYTSMIIKYKLYYKIDLGKMIRSSNRADESRRIDILELRENFKNKADKFDYSSIEEFKLKDTLLLKDWVSFENDEEYQTMLNRFKRMPKHLTEESTIEEMIDGQKMQENKHTVPYPFNSVFPLPLWFK